MKTWVAVGTRLRALRDLQGLRVGPLQHVIRHASAVRGSAKSAYKSASKGFGSSDDGYKEVIEKGVKIRLKNDNSTFYNEVQVMNRDLSVLVISHFAKVRELENEAKYQKRLRSYESKKANNEPDCHEPVKESGISILEAFAATGIRSLRYIQEVPGVRSITVNDFDATAIKTLRDNFAYNSCADDNRVVISHNDAAELMYSCRSREKNFDVIDLDPYGSASEFIDCSIQALSDGGLLCVTSTDMRALCGDNSEACYVRYNAMPFRKSDFRHEASIRILLQYLDSVASKYGKVIVPWLSVSVDFYVRVFVRVYESAFEASSACSRKSLVFQSVACPSFYLQPLAQSKKKTTQHSQQTEVDSDEEPMSTAPMIKQSPSTTPPQFVASVSRVPPVCEESRTALRMAGPFWSTELHDKEIVTELLTELTDNASSQSSLPTAKRLSGILQCIQEEIDAPFYYMLPALFGAVSLPCMVTRNQFANALINSGYKVSAFHREPGSIKTDAPNHVVSISPLHLGLRLKC
jgi:tRNA (guanine26-N2/guanine27-N2)-dimethyltransferase